MLEQGEAWFLVADGRKARMWLQVRRGASLERVADGEMNFSDEDALEAQDRPARVHESVGPMRHGSGDDRDLRQEEEDRFLARVTQRLDKLAQAGGFAHLVIAAPPRALGVLRGLLTPALQQRLRAEIPKDVLKEPQPNLQARFAEALRSA